MTCTRCKSGLSVPPLAARGEGRIVFGEQPDGPRIKVDRGVRQHLPHEGTAVGTEDSHEADHERALLDMAQALVQP